MLQKCNSSSGQRENVLTHAAVLLLSSNRELSPKRRDLIRPDLNKQYASLCNPSTPVSSFLFGDELNKEVEELTKSRKISSKVTPRKRMEPYRVPSGRGVRARNRFNRCGGRGNTPASPFLRRGRAKYGPSSVPSSHQQRLSRVFNRGGSSFCCKHYCQSNSL